MDADPPKCYLGYCNVRSWTLITSVISIVICTIEIFTNLASIIESPWKASFGILVYTVIVSTNIRLRRAVLKHNLAPIRDWLWVYSITFVVFVTMGIINVILCITRDPFDAKAKQLLVWNVVILMTIGVFWVLFSYPVYQYYNHEKTRLPQTVMPGCERL